RGGLELVAVVVTGSLLNDRGPPAAEGPVPLRPVEHDVVAGRAGQHVVVAARRPVRVRMPRDRVILGDTDRLLLVLLVLLVLGPRPEPAPDRLIVVAVVGSSRNRHRSRPRFPCSK